MVQFKKEKECDASQSLRIFDAEVGHFNPIHMDSDLRPNFTPHR